MHKYDDSCPHGEELDETWIVQVLGYSHVCIGLVYDLKQRHQSLI